MNNQNDGGAAFPFHPETTAEQMHGMSLRDWFAGQAISEAGQIYTNPGGIAAHAYKIADAMLKAREET